MLKAIAVIAGVLVVAVVAFLVYASTRPDTFRVARSTSVKAPPEKVFALIDDFHKWGAWSPYEHRDPEMKRSYGGPESGVGSTYGWNGNRNIGSGRMEIVEATPPSRIAIKLDFSSPFEAHNTALFTMVPNGDTTEVTWAMEGPATLMSKAIGLVFNMDRMVGGDFEQGLAAIKSNVESPSTVVQ